MHHLPFDSSQGSTTATGSAAIDMLMSSMVWIRCISARTELVATLVHPFETPTQHEDLRSWNTSKSASAFQGAQGDVKP